MSAPIYSSPAIHINENDCVDVHADAQAVVAGFLCKAANFSIHFESPEQAIEWADYLTEGATRCIAAREPS